MSQKARPIRAPSYSPELTFGAADVDDMRLGMRREIERAGDEQKRQRRARERSMRSKEALCARPAPS